jgi:hypothetical protein
LSKQTSKQGILKLNNRETKMTGNNRDFSILTLNVNSLNVPMKRHKIANWIKKQDPSICCLQETHITKKKLNTGLELKG